MEIWHQIHSSLVSPPEIFTFFLRHRPLTPGLTSWGSCPPQIRMGIQGYAQALRTVLLRSISALSNSIFLTPPHCVSVLVLPFEHGRYSGPGPDLGDCKLSSALRH